ncbi:Histone-lysine N-methyltransferase ASHR3 [Glycine max]|nr:Histone-lysine N-methyltransferase ASHR3 [Glycine max]
MQPWVLSHHPLKITKPHFPAHFFLIVFFSSPALLSLSASFFSLPYASVGVGKFLLRISAMPDLGNLSLSAALKHSHCSSSNALDAPVKTLTNGFGSNLPSNLGECCFCCHFIYLGDDELLCSVRGCDTRYHSECAKEAVGPSTLKKFKCPQHVYFICKKKQFRCVRCKVAFHSKCSPWSDSMLQLKDHPGHTVCWRHPYDWRLDRKVG